MGCLPWKPEASPCDSYDCGMPVPLIYHCWLDNRKVIWTLKDTAVVPTPTDSFWVMQPDPE